MVNVGIRWTMMIVSGLLMASSAVAQHGGGLRVLQADYGTRGRACDATYAVAQRCNGVRQCEVVASNNLCGDPFGGKKKTLTIRYLCPTGEYFAEAQEDGKAVLRCEQGNRRARDEVNRVGRGIGLYVEAADYVAGQKACNATRALQRACNDTASCSVSVDNNLCGDPFKGKRKHLEVTYFCAGERYTRNYNEGQIARLDCR